MACINMVESVEGQRVPVVSTLWFIVKHKTLDRPSYVSLNHFRSFWTAFELKIRIKSYDNIKSNLFSYNIYCLWFGIYILFELVSYFVWFAYCLNSLFMGFNHDSDDKLLDFKGWLKNKVIGIKRKVNWLKTKNHFPANWSLSLRLQVHQTASLHVPELSHKM